MAQQKIYADVNERMQAYRERKRQAEAEAERRHLARVEARRAVAYNVRHTTFRYLSDYRMEVRDALTAEERDYLNQIVNGILRMDIRVKED